ncbi:MAG: hypothetical protein ACRDJW_08975 [Thermomicrobiales bacterium]
MEMRLEPGNGLLQIGATLAAIAIALATLTHREGPELRGVHAIPALFLLAGLVALIGSLYAMAQLWEEMGLTTRDVFGDRAHAADLLSPNAYLALVVTTWGLWILSAAYLALLVHNAA